MNVAPLLEYDNFDNQKDIQLTVGSQYPGQRRAAIMFQNSGSFASHSAGSSWLGHSPPTRIA